ncbi:hypothetical protein TRSC58_02898 [Trypanosoma rangeli SC58]|uniref:Tyrosine specific protein phosphatases domain-containing protein n=1 Tax=Trypanosoma rangeli SC58 TaxID=429131 RepID=A0A061J4W8_TRYRA|nr:hypothetical protein TRSC58_02898 [Trypanosoma rangeli SC58]
MTAEVLKQYLLRWRRDEQGGTLSPTAARTSSIALELPRSFRPHRIVPLVYLGALKDVADAWALHQRLLPDELLLTVSTCSRSSTPMLEMRELLPVRTPRKAVGAPRVQRLAVCSWERLSEIVHNLSGGATSQAGAEKGVRETAAWLRHSLGSRSFLGDNDTAEVPARETAARGGGTGLVYLKLCLPWRDEPAFPAREHFAVATALMQAVVNGLGKAVVCHCVAGASRSVTLVCAYLLRCCCSGGDTAGCGDGGAAEEAVKTVLEFVREVRLCACPNEGFMQQLTQYASLLLSANAKLM